MVSATNAIEHYRCPSCKMWFHVLRERVLEYQSGSFNCTKCKVEVISWIGVFAYSNWTEVGKPKAETKPIPNAF
jgi:hypothetical protein